ncbi:MAG: hypothetical protein H0Z33_13135 [Bacillaceae bacterium]|nr:hypothetical protein [Bacillaceae bacterium]
MGMKEGILKNSRKALFLLIILVIVVTAISVLEYTTDRKSYLSAVDQLHMSMSNANEALKEATLSADKESFEEKMILASFWIGRTQTSFEYLIVESKDYWIFDESKLLNSKLLYLRDHLSGILQCIDNETEWGNQEGMRTLKLIQKHLDWLINEDHKAFFRALKNSDTEKVSHFINKWDEYRYRALTPYGDSVCD